MNLFSIYMDYIYHPALTGYSYVKAIFSHIVCYMPFIAS